MREPKTKKAFFSINVKETSERTKVSRKASLCALFVVLSLLCSSCSINFSSLRDLFRPNSAFAADKNAKPLNDADLVLLLLSSITNPISSNIQQVFSQLPESQVRDVSFSMFDAYVRLMNRMIGRNITAFRILKTDEREERLNILAERSPGFLPVIQQSVPVEVQISGDQKARYLYFQRQENGNGFLSLEWMQACLDLSRYASLYFLSIEQSNQEAVESLLQNAVIPEFDGDISSLVIHYKAQGIISYYTRQVRESSSNFQLTEADATALTYVQPRFFNEIKGTTTERPVHFVRRTTDIISVRDTVSGPLKTRDMILHREGLEQSMIRVGSTIADNVLREFLGEPLIVSHTLKKDENTPQIIVAGYRSFSVTVMGRIKEDGTWWGRIIRIRVWSDEERISLGPSLSVGMSLDSLLRQYPFADLEDYALESVVEGQTYRMTFSMESSGTVEAINLEIVDPPSVLPPDPVEVE